MGDAGRGADTAPARRYAFLHGGIHVVLRCGIVRTASQSSVNDPEKGYSSGRSHNCFLTGFIRM